jgi:hypothetical protein
MGKKCLKLFTQPVLRCRIEIIKVWYSTCTRSGTLKCFRWTPRECGMSAAGFIFVIRKEETKLDAAKLPTTSVYQLRINFLRLCDIILSSRFIWYWVERKVFAFFKWKVNHCFSIYMCIYIQYLTNYIISIACYYRLPTCRKLFSSGLVKTSWFWFKIC